MKYALTVFEKSDLPQATELWNSIVAEGNSFPQDEILSPEQALDFFRSQTDTICAIYEGQVVGLYILHPNNVGRCSHVANASYAVKKEFRGEGLGKALVQDSLNRAKARGFSGLQFNAVLTSNLNAVTLYLKLGFSVVGTIKNGFRLSKDSYCNTLIFYKEL